MNNFLGIDYGKKRTGLAYSEGELAEPLKIIKSKNLGQLLKKIAEIIVQKNINIVVIGMPEGDLVKEIKEFAKKIQKSLKVEVVFEDESLTSKEAIKKMVEAGKPLQQRRKQEDLFSACIILQKHLDSLTKTNN